VISAIVTIVYSVALMAAAFFYLNGRYKLLEKDTVSGVIRKNVKYFVLTCVVFVLMSVIHTLYALKHDIYVIPILMKWATLFWGGYLLAKVDYHEKKIPNKIILVLLCFRLAFLAYEVFSNLEYWKKVIAYPLLGALIGGIILLAAMVISRKGIGMGDVKLFIVIGAFVGSTEILMTIFYIFLISAIGGLVMILSKKAKLTDTIPMAPFACVGIALEYILLTMGD